MYRPGDVQLAPSNCPRDEEGDCTEFDHRHPADSRANFEHLYGGAYLPHSCDSWVIGGPEQIHALIRDLQAALVKLGGWTAV